MSEEIGPVPAGASGGGDREQYSCRMYRNKYPEIDELVMVNVRQIAEMGAYVNLLEYNNVEGMVLLSELSRRRIRSVQKLIRVGRNEVVVVLRVDKEKGRIYKCRCFMSFLLFTSLLSLLPLFRLH